MIYHFILNPKSGRPHRQKNVEKIIKEECRARQLNYHIYYTTCVGDATEYVCSMVRISEDRQRFICVGGDGTLSEVVNSAPSNPNVEFGIIPYGSGNDFVRNFNRRELFDSLSAQLDGEVTSLDLIKYNDSYAVNMINIGLDCSAAHNASKLKKYKFISKSFAYTLGLFMAFFKRIGTKMRIIFDDGEVWEDSYTLTAIGNGKFCGGGYKALPGANLKDGMMDICSVNKLSRFTLLRFIYSYKKGKHIYFKNPDLYFKMKSVSHFKMEFDTPVAICIDGEIKGVKNINVEVVKNAFNFVIPKGAAFIE